MHRVFSAAFAATAAVGATSPASAKVVVEANGARADERWGGELGLGYAIPIAGGLRITPAAGVLLYQGDNDRYRRDDNGGDPRCRDTSNGQYADSETCNTVAVRAYGRVEATYSLPASMTLGAGVRISDEVKPYGTVAFPLAPKVQIKGNAGPDYYAVGLRFGV